MRLLQFAGVVLGLVLLGCPLAASVGEAAEHRPVQGEAVAADEALTAFEEGEYERALALWLPRAMQGEAFAQVQVGHMYAAGTLLQQDNHKALEWYRRAADQGEASAQVQMGHAYATGVLPQDDRKALKLYQRAAEQGDADGLFQLGMMHHAGRGTPVDWNEAAKWYRLAAEQGHPRAEQAAFLVGEVENPHWSVADVVEHYRVVAEDGDVAAQRVLGFMLEHGVGTAQDIEKAISWYRLAAEQGGAEAQFRLASIYERGGNRSNRDELRDEAYEFYRLAAEQGHIAAKRSIADILLDGSDQDFWIGVALLEEVANQGDVEAQISLGFVFEDDLDDYEQAAMWYRMAADQGNLSAASELQELLALGRVVPLDEEELERLQETLRDWPDDLGQQWFLESRRKAERGSAQDKFEYGFLLHRLQHIKPTMPPSYFTWLEQDDVEAAHWYRLAATEGHPEAKGMLALLRAETRSEFESRSHRRG